MPLRNLCQFYPLNCMRKRDKSSITQQITLIRTAPGPLTSENIGVCKHGQVGTCPIPRNVVSCVCAANVVSPDTVFMHYFKRMSSATGSFSPRPATMDPAGGLPSFRPLIAHPRKKSCRYTANDHGQMVKGQGHMENAHYSSKYPSPP